MSVHQESLEMSKPMERVEEAPELEYRAVSHDSLSMFLAAIGGAILGMLLTLLILALINGGTLSFSGGERLTVFETKLQAVDRNVDAVSHNVDAVSQQAATLQNQLGSVETALRSEIATQGANVATMGKAITELDKTRAQFNTFIGALSEAMASMNKIGAPAESAAPAQPAAEKPATPAEAPLATLSAENSADVAAGALSVVLFVDANANGKLDADEAKVAGAAVTLKDSADKAIASEKSTNSGVLFKDLKAGDYKIAIEDAAGRKLLSAAQADVKVAEGAKEGQVIFVPVAVQ